jgi:hypothetical protein
MTERFMIARAFGATVHLTAAGKGFAGIKEHYVSGPPATTASAPALPSGGILGSPPTTPPCDLGWANPSRFTAGRPVQGGGHVRRWSVRATLNRNPNHAKLDH